MSKTIMVVDDDDLLRELVANEFETKGYKVHLAGNGIEALKILEENPDISIILSDVRMPKMDGIELLKNVKAKDPKTPVFIFISGYSDYEPSEINAMGADRVFDKPFNINKIFEAVSKLSP
ncbi:MAG: response regulator [Myxococcota bacterium]